MATYLARKYYNGDGSTQTFVLPATMGYISTSYIHAYVKDGNGVFQEVSYTWDNSNTIRINPAPATGTANVLVKRETPNDARLVTFTDGAGVLGAELNKDSNQSFHLSQETVDQTQGAVEDTEAARDVALGARDDALAAQTAAETAQGLAETAQGLAETAESGAQTAQAAAEAAQAACEAIEESIDVSTTDIHNANSKTSPADADETLLLDSATSFTLKKLTWANLKAAIQSYLSSIFAPIAKGVDNGNSHDHNGGDGAQIDHTTLANIGLYTHAEIDARLLEEARATGNLVINGGAERNTLDFWTNTAGLSVQSATGGGSNKVFQITRSGSDFYCQQAKFHTDGSQVSRYFEVKPGQAFVIGGDVYSPGSSCKAGVWLFYVTKDFAWVGSDGVGRQTAGWGHISKVCVVPTNAHFALFTCGVEVANGTCQFDNMYMRYYHGWVDRGDPANFDWTMGNLTIDSSWHSLSLSSIIPDGAVAVEVLVAIGAATQLNHYIVFMESNHSYAYNAMYCQVQSSDMYYKFRVPVTDAKTIQYLACTNTYTRIDILICGWLVP